MGSIPVRVTKTKGHPLRVSFLFWCPVPQSARDKNALRFYPMGSQHCSAASVSEAMQGGANSRTRNLTRRRSRWVLICRSKIGKLVCQAQSVQIFAQRNSHRIPPKAVSCVIRRVGRRIANSRTCLPLAFSFFHSFRCIQFRLTSARLAIYRKRYAPNSIIGKVW